MLFESLNLFQIVWLFFHTLLYVLLPYTKNKGRGYQCYQQATISLLVRFFVSHRLKNLPPQYQLMAYFSQSIRNVSNNFRSLIILRVSMFTVLLFWFSQAFRFFTKGILMVVEKITFNPRSNFCNIVLLCKKTFQCLHFKCFFEGTSRILESWC